MRSTLLLLILGIVTSSADWRTAQPGWTYQFPRDHGDHPEFKTEWWYFTGNLAAPSGNEFGYQLTFFRQGIGPPSQDLISTSRFVTQHLKFAHFALSDIGAEKFRFFQRFSRGAYGEAGFGSGERLVWLENWSLVLSPQGSYRLHAEQDDCSIDLELVPSKGPIIHGRNGVSQKAEGEGRASLYYSHTGLRTIGIIRMGDTSTRVEGTSWFDHEWATNQLAPGQQGWDWLSLHLSDGSELMLYQLRSEQGEIDPMSSGTFIGAKGPSIHLTRDDFSMDPIKWWTSPSSGARYPTTWEIAIPTVGVTLRAEATFNNQELRLRPVTYWEGAVRATGTRDGSKIVGKGYLELTGYATPLDGLTEH